MKRAWERGVFDNTNFNLPHAHRGAYVPRLPQIENRMCIICSSSFQKRRWQKGKTCGKTCFKELCRRNSRANPNCGGDTNYRKYKYNNIWMDSTWEVDLAKWMDSNSIMWERDRKKHQFMWTDSDGNKRRYYPDFYLPLYGVYLDPKNKYLKKVDGYKINQVIRENKITLFWGLLNDVKKELDILRGV
jgi:hypothetical protein